MKNFGDVFQLSQGNAGPGGAACLAAHFMCKSRGGTALTRALRRSAAAFHMIWEV